MDYWTEKKTDVNLTIRASFSPYYRTNRHGTRIAHVWVKGYISGTEKIADLQFTAICRVSPKKREIKWQFPKACSEAINNEVKSLFSEEEIFGIFENMKESTRVF